MAEEPPDDEALLTALDRQNRLRLADQLLRTSPPAPENELSASGLAGVLFDVLVEGYQADTESRKQLDEVWGRLEGDDKVITRRTFDYEAFMVGAYATIVAVDLALEGDDKARVLASFQREPAAIPNRIRRVVPGRGRFRWYMAYYDTALGPERHPDRTWYVPVGRAFATACREQAADREAFAGAEHQIAAAGLEVFLRAASGTIDAVRGWTIT